MNTCELLDSQESKYDQMVDQFLLKGYAVLDDFIPQDWTHLLRQQLSNYLNQGFMKPAGVGKGHDYMASKKVRGDLIRWIDEDTQVDIEQHFLNLINDFVQYLNRFCFTGINAYEFHYACYQKLTFYKRHLDQFLKDSARKYSFVFYLNDNWSENDGGQLTLYSANGEIDILPIGGRVVFFPSDTMEHEVKPSFKRRMSIAGWLKHQDVL